MRFLICYLIVGLSSAAVFNLEAEMYNGDGAVSERPGASGGRVVMMTSGEKLKMSFCLQKESMVFLEDINFNSESKEYNIDLHLDFLKMGDFKQLNGKSSTKDQGRSRGFRRGVFLSRGRHLLRFHVAQADKHGVQVDVVRVKVQDDDLTEDGFFCKSFCFSQIPFASSRDRMPINDELKPMKAVQGSTFTKCAEEDNVNILLYHDNIKQYKIRARHPSYHSLANNREPDFTNCKFVDNMLWKISEIDLSKKEYTIERNNVRMAFRKTHWSVVELAVGFTVKGRSQGSNDDDVGNVLTVVLSPTISSGIFVSAVTIGRNREWKYIGNRYYDPNRREVLTWNIRDYSWSADEKNTIRLIFIGDDLAKAKVSQITLEKRRLRPDKTFLIYNSDNMVVEGVDIDMWWLRNNITITVEGSDRKWNASYFRFSFPIPWTTGYSQSFVMYQDGNVRLLPPSPHGADWIPFGSSVLIGQVNPFAMRPFTEISTIHIYPETQRFDISYMDGGFVTVRLEIQMEEAIIHISVDKLGKDPYQFPFLSFRSMWVKDGNSDVDHLSADGRYSRHILGAWGAHYGHAFTFFRSCISKHNTQSPDIHVEVIR